MTNFKVGDRVRVVIRDGNDILLPRNILTVTKATRCLTADGGQYLYFDELPKAQRGGWDSDRFELVEDVSSVSSDSKSEAAKRKAQPIARGVLDYFPAALIAVSELSRIGNEKHNPGQPLHHSRSKSSDHADCIVRHLLDRGTIDPETGLSHSVAVAWRALALLQEELEASGAAPKARGAK